MALAEAGRAVLAVSVDQAHSLADVFDVTGATDIRGVRDHLDVLEIDSLALLEKRYSAVSALAALAGSHDHAAGFDLPTAEELTGLPGVQELLALWEITRLADSGRWDTIVVDAPASADAVRMLTAPRTTVDYLERLWPPHSRIDAAGGPDPRAGFVVGLYDRILQGIGSIRDLLDDGARTEVVLVAGPDRSGIAELRRLRSWLALAGLHLESVVVNGVAPRVDGSGEAARLLADRRRAHLEKVDEIRSTVTEVPVRVCEQTPDEPVGLAALGRFAGRMCRDEREPEASGSRHAPVRVEHESGTGLEAVYAMRMYLPLADPASLTLGRVDDDLVVGADGMRRRVRLASGLRRCKVDGAEFAGTDLVVRFVPDPAVWPR